MPTMKLAFDRSARRIDADGRLHVDRSHISKATVNPYYGREIPGYEALGLEPDKVYRLFRDPVELERGAATFARLPILSEHVPVTVDAPRPDHVAANGKRYKIAEGCLISGEHIQPGEDINCRCTSRPVLPI